MNRQGLRRLIDLVGYVAGHPLNRHSRMRALLRVLRWQFGARLLPGACALPFVNGTHLIARRGQTGVSGNWYCGLHEWRDMGFVLHALRSCDLFVDVGANVGSYTILAAGAVGAEVIAVEPVPATYRDLKQNVQLNGLNDRVACRNLGLGEMAGTLRFTVGQDTVNHVLAAGESAASVVVPVMTIDALCDGRVPTLVKIDVEGYEHAVVEGGVTTLANPNCRAVILETNGSGRRYGWRDAAIVDRLRGFGFATCAYDPRSRELTKAPASNANTLFVRDPSTMAVRVRQAPRFRLVNGTI